MRPPADEPDDGPGTNHPQVTADRDEGRARSEPTSADGAPRRHQALVALDVSIVVGLTVAAFLLRRDLPSDGLFYDDAWQALAAREANLGNLLTVGQSQPGWTLELIAWSRIAGDAPRTFVIPALVAGCLGPPALYLTLRQLRFPRVIALLLGTMLVVSTTHIIYSTRVKSYTTDVLILLGLTLVVARLVGRRWGPRTSAAWFVGASALAVFSSISLLAAAVAGVVLVVDARGDRIYRLAAVAGQAVVSALVFVVTSGTYDQANVAGFFGERGGFLDLSLNPLRTARQLGAHLTNVVDVFPGGPRGVLGAGVVVVLGGLALAAWRGPRRVAARYLLLLLGVAIAGAYAHKLPFGPPSRPKVRGLGRVSLWLIPVVAVGAAVALEGLRRATTSRPPLRRAFDVVAVLGAAALLFTAVGDGHANKPGASSVSEEAVAQLGPDDVVWLTRVTTYSFAIATDVPVELRSTPERLIGFLPDFDDPRIVVTDFETPDEELAASLVGADRVLLVHGLLRSQGYNLRNLQHLSLILKLSGFEQESVETIEGASLSTWVR